MLHTSVYHRTNVAAAAAAAYMKKDDDAPPKTMTPSRNYKRIFSAYQRKSNIETFLTFFTIGLALLVLGMWVGMRLAESGQFLSSSSDASSSLPFNSQYKIPDSHPEVGDRSTSYVLHRKKYDGSTPNNAERSLKFAQNLHVNTFDTFPFETHHSDQVNTYDIYNCPDIPPSGYPLTWNVMDVLEHWPASDTTPRPFIHQGLCVFDYQKDYDKAMTYRDLELPFVVKNDPNIAKSVERWNSPGYMESILGDIPHRTEYSENNHFLYSVPLPKSVLRGKEPLPKSKKHLEFPKDWKPPTDLQRMSYREWLDHANITDRDVASDEPHWYYRLIGCGKMGNQGQCDEGSSEYLFDELPFFQPQENLYLREPWEQKGIHCRFGMQGVIAENHFDAGRNTIVLLKGSRRYLLAHPDQCEFMALYPKTHPSARHSQVDWTNPDLEKFPQFANTQINEVVLQPGDAMYLPTFWFHFIVSLELNFQCNTRSGMGYEYAEPIKQCGFKP